MSEICVDMNFHPEKVSVVPCSINQQPATEKGQVRVEGCILQDSSGQKPDSECVVTLYYSENQKAIDVVSTSSATSIDGSKSMTSQIISSGNNPKPTDEFMQPTIHKSGYIRSQLPQEDSGQKPSDEFVLLPIDKSDHKESQLCESVSDQKRIDELIQPSIVENLQVRANGYVNVPTQVIPLKVEKISAARQQVPVDVDIKVHIDWNGEISGDEGDCANETPQTSAYKKGVQIYSEEVSQVSSDNHIKAFYPKEQTVSNEGKHYFFDEDPKVHVNPKYQIASYGNIFRSFDDIRQEFFDENSTQINREETFQAPPNKTIEFVNLKEQMLQSKKKQQSSGKVLQVFVPRRYGIFDCGSSQSSGADVRQISCDESKIKMSHDFLNKTKQVRPRGSGQQLYERKHKISGNQRDYISVCKSSLDSIDEIREFSTEEKSGLASREEMFLPSSSRNVNFVNMRKKMFSNDDDHVFSDKNLKAVTELRKKLSTAGSSQGSADEKSTGKHKKKIFQFPSKKNIKAFNRRDEIAPGRRPQTSTMDILANQGHIVAYPTQRQRTHIISFFVALVVAFLFIIAMLVCWLA